ncbi:hypothetical protein DL96DRAFT_1685432 [Flagelloscypha sp. PMI_526]|nr:hypothetical protein DL96DRAFT_1685432 [Flagelloscypha sp. PMI_526]
MAEFDTEHPLNGYLASFEDSRGLGQLFHNASQWALTAFRRRSAARREKFTDKFKLAVVNSGILSEELLSSHVGTATSGASLASLEMLTARDSEPLDLDPPSLIFACLVLVVILGVQTTLLLALLFVGAWAYIHASPIADGLDSSEEAEHETATEALSSLESLITSDTDFERSLSKVLPMFSEMDTVNEEPLALPESSIFTSPSKSLSRRSSFSHGVQHSAAHMSKKTQLKADLERTIEITTSNLSSVRQSVLESLGDSAELRMLSGMYGPDAPTLDATSLAIDGPALSQAERIERREEIISAFKSPIKKSHPKPLSLASSADSSLLSNSVPSSATSDKRRTWSPSRSPFGTVSAASSSHTQRQTFPFSISTGSLRSRPTSLSPIPRTSEAAVEIPTISPRKRRRKELGVSLGPIISRSHDDLHTTPAEPFSATSSSSTSPPDSATSRSPRIGTSPLKAPILLDDDIEDENENLATMYSDVQPPSSFFTRKPTLARSRSFTHASTSSRGSSHGVLHNSTMSASSSHYNHVKRKTSFRKNSKPTLQALLAHLIQQRRWTVSCLLGLKFAGHPLEPPERERKRDKVFHSSHSQRRRARALQQAQESEEYWTSVISVLELLKFVFVEAKEKVDRLLSELDPAALIKSELLATSIVGDTSRRHRAEPQSAALLRENELLPSQLVRGSLHQQQPGRHFGRVHTKRPSVKDIFQFPDTSSSASTPSNPLILSSTSAPTSFAPTIAPSKRLSTHLLKIEELMDGVGSELVGVAEAATHHHRTSSTDEEQMILARYENLRHQLGIALRECERARPALMDILHPPSSRLVDGEDEGDEGDPGLTSGGGTDESSVPPYEDEPHRSIFGGDDGVGDLDLNVVEPTPLFESSDPFLVDEGEEEVWTYDFPPPKLSPLGNDAEDGKFASGVEPGEFKRERSKMSREERIRLAKEKRELKAQQQPSTPTLGEEDEGGEKGYGPSKDVVQELKDVIWLVGEKRKSRVASVDKSLSPEAPSPTLDVL